jgi:hypothetical protein
LCGLTGFALAAWAIRVGTDYRNGTGKAAWLAVFWCLNAAPFILYASAFLRNIRPRALHTCLMAVLVTGVPLIFFLPLRGESGLYALGSICSLALAGLRHRLSAGAARESG